MVTKILSVGTSLPETSFTQEEVAHALRTSGEKALRFFHHPHIKKRHLLFPETIKAGQKLQEESPEELRKKFLAHSLPLSAEAIKKALEASGHELGDISYLVCVTSTAFIVPGLSALIVNHLNLKRSVQRLDIVGMGCHAGLNGLSAVSAWSKSNPGKLGILLCCELSSCIYTIDNEENTALVNSLFGDGVAAAVLKTDETKNSSPEIVSFESFVIPNTQDCLRFNFMSERNRYNFYVDKRTPERLASFVDIPLKTLLSTHNLAVHDIQHWILHTGGEAILSGIEKKLNLSQDKLKHTRSILLDYGNISSGSFLFSYQRLMEETRPAGHGVMMTMGPGLTIECALIKWD